MSSRKASRLSVEEDHYEIGDKVFLHGLKKWGLVRFCGKTLFSDGLWLGVELSEPCGKNDGAVQRTRYFRCPHMCGVFIRPMNCSTSEASMSRPNTPDMRRRLSSRSAGLVMTPTRIMPRRGLQPASTGKLKGHPGKAEDGEWEQFRPRSHSHYDELESSTCDREEFNRYNNDISTSTHYSSVHEKYDDNGVSPYSPRKDRRVNLINRMTDAIKSQSLDQTDKESQPSPPVTPAFRHFSPGRERLNGDDHGISVPQGVHQQNAVNHSSSLATVRDSVGSESGEAPSKSGYVGDDNARLNSLESKMATLLASYQMQREASEQMEKQLGGRVTHLEETLNGIESTLGSINCALESILATRNEANNNGEESDQAGLVKEVEQLKGALAMVSSLAKQAHKATIKERREHTEKIQQLQSRLDAHENVEPN